MPESLARVGPPSAPRASDVPLFLLAGLVVAVFVLKGTTVDGDAVLAGMAGTLVAVTAWRGWPRLGRANGALFWGYLATIAVSTVASAQPPRWPAVAAAAGAPLLARAVDAALASTVARAIAFALVVGCALLVVVPAAAWGASSATDVRPLIYLPAIQWSGYPELGLLSGLGFAGLLAYGGITPTTASRASAWTLASAFALAAVAMRSRAAVATLVVMTVLVAVSLLWWRRTFLTLVLIGLAMAVAVLRPAGSLSLESLGERAKTLSQQLSSSAEAVARVESWQRARLAIAEHPWVGRGPGRFPMSYPGEHAHNVVLHTAVELGGVGATLFLLLWLHAIVTATKGAGPTPEGRVALAVAAMLTSVLVRSQVDHFFSADTTTSVRCWIVFSVVWGLASSCARNPRTDGRAADDVSERPSARSA
ncbi:MAG: O-antigen ligase family protein [Vicinamibacterales bacterium]